MKIPPEPPDHPWSIHFRVQYWGYSYKMEMGWQHLPAPLCKDQVFFGEVKTRQCMFYGTKTARSWRSGAANRCLKKIGWTIKVARCFRPKCGLKNLRLDDLGMILASFFRENDVGSSWEFLFERCPCHLFDHSILCDLRKTKALRFQVSFVNSSRGSTANRRSGRSGRRAGRSEVDEVAPCLRGLEGENHGFLNVFCKFFLTQIHWIEHQTHSTVKCWKNMFEVTTWTTAISSSDLKIILFAGCDFAGFFDELNS